MTGCTRPGVRLRVLAGAVVGASLWVSAPARAQINESPEYDLVIRNGRVLDGAGNPWVAVDVAIHEGRFAKIGQVAGRGVREIDASGRYVAPGFIDMMDQSGSVLLRNGLAENKLRMGVTTAIGGEGGIPRLPDVTEEEWAATGGAGKLTDYFAALEAEGISINFGTYYSETQTRRAVLGSANRAPDDTELERMKALMREAMEAGALGMTTALIYPPSSYASTDELIEVAREAAALGGIYASHIRDEGRGLVGAVAEAAAIGEGADIPVEVFHFKAAYEPGWGTTITEAIDTIEAARARGVDIAADLYPYTAGGTGLEATIPSWAHEGGSDSLLARLADPETRSRLKREVETGSPGWWNIIEAAGGWDGVVLVNARNEQNARWENRSIAEIAQETERDPRDAAWDIVAAGDGRVMAIYHMMDEGDIRTALQQEWVSIGSDAGAAMEAGVADGLGLPHPRSYGTFPRVLAHFVRDLGALSLEEGVSRMTSWPATRMRLFDRGVIREGLRADLVVFDLDALEDVATYEDPTAFPTGIDMVIVNGTIVIDGGAHTGARPGMVLRGPGAKVPSRPR